LKKFYQVHPLDFKTRRSFHALFHVRRVDITPVTHDLSRPKVQLLPMSRQNLSLSGGQALGSGREHRLLYGSSIPHSILPIGGSMGIQNRKRLVLKTNCDAREHYCDT
jgi:hypothetical protein